MKQSICIFPDTNVFLHFPPLKDTDWCAIGKAKSVQLIICTTVIHELDGKKSDPRLSARAERAIKEIKEAHKSGSEIRANVSVSVFNREVRSADFPDTLSPDSADDRIVHLAKLYQTENPSDEVAIATGDYGMELRAEAGGIPSIGLEDSLRLPNPQDETTKKYRQAISELNALKNRLPRLSVGLAHPDGQNCLPHKIRFETGPVSEPIDVEAEMEVLRRRHPKQSENQAEIPPYLRTHLSLLEPICAEEWDEYNSDLDDFYVAYRTHLELLNTIADAKSRAFWFDLWLNNEGNGLATDIDAFIRFPECVRFVAEKGTDDAAMLEEELVAPKPPKRPQPFGLGRLDSGYVNLIPQHLENISRIELPHRRDDWTPKSTVHRNESHLNEIRTNLGKLKHGHPVCLGTFVTIFRSADDIGPFNAEISISTSELAEKTVQKLPFIVKRVKVT